MAHSPLSHSHFTYLGSFPTLVYKKVPSTHPLPLLSFSFTDLQLTLISIYLLLYPTYHNVIFGSIFYIHRCMPEYCLTRRRGMGGWSVNIS